MNRSINKALVVGALSAVIGAVGLGVGIASADNGDRPSCSASSAAGWDGTGAVPDPCPVISSPGSPVQDGNQDTVSHVPDGDTVPLPVDQLASVPAMPEPQG
jgi:hypothetical protein